MVTLLLHLELKISQNITYFFSRTNTTTDDGGNTTDDKEHPRLPNRNLHSSAGPENSALSKSDKDSTESNPTSSEADQRSDVSSASALKDLDSSNLSVFEENSQQLGLSFENSSTPKSPCVQDENNMNNSHCPSLNSPEKFIDLSQGSEQSDAHTDSNALTQDKHQNKAATAENSSIVSQDFSGKSTSLPHSLAADTLNSPHDSDSMVIGQGQLNLSSQGELGSLNSNRPEALASQWGSQSVGSREDIAVKSWLVFSDDDESTKDGEALLQNPVPLDSSRNAQNSHNIAVPLCGESSDSAYESPEKIQYLIDHAEELVKTSPRRSGTGSPKRQGSPEKHNQSCQVGMKDFLKVRFENGYSLFLIKYSII